MTLAADIGTIVPEKSTPLALEANKHLSASLAELDLAVSSFIDALAEVLGPEYDAPDVLSGDPIGEASPLVSALRSHGVVVGNITTAIRRAHSRLEV